jgi:hydroxymethylglutaryl-CoA reductase
MSLHARNIAIAAGATGTIVDAVAESMIKEKKIRMDRAKELITELSSKT